MREVLGLRDDLGADVPQELSGALDAAVEAEWPGEAPEALEEVRALLEDWEEAGQAGSADPGQVDRVRRKLKSVLERPEFLASTRAQGWVARAEQALKDLLQSLFTGRDGTLPDLPWDAMVRALGIGLGAVLLLLGVWAAVLLVRSRRGAGPDLALPAPEGLHEGLERTSSGWLEAADREAAKEDYRAALRYVFLGLLRRLDELHVLQLERDRTNWELVRQMGDDPRRPDLEAATRLFESHWYALRQAAPDDYRELRDRYDRLVRS